MTFFVTELVALFFILGQRAPEKREGEREEMRSRTGTLRDDKVSGFGGRLNEMTDPSRHPRASGQDLDPWIAFKTRSRSVAYRDDGLFLLQVILVRISMLS
jgi:hypothetical protein